MPRFSRSALGLALCCLLAAPTPAQTDAADLLRTLQDQLDAGRHAEALVTARRCSKAMPGNAAIWYNLAGLEEHQGHRPDAVAALRQAVVLGFDDFRFADTDDDLGDLRHDPRYDELRAAWAAGLATRIRSRRVELAAGVWSDTIDLVDRRGGLHPPAAEMTLRPGATALEVVIETDAKPLGQTPPWRGGNGVLVSVVLPETDTTGEGRYGAEFGLGMADGLPVGAVRLGSHWQRLAELTPKFRRDSAAGHLVISFTVPWSICGSLHPLVDKELGLNVTVLLDDGRAAWIDDPASGRADHPWRRGIPLHVDWTGTTSPAIQGLPADHIVRTPAVRLQVSAVASGPGAGVRFVLRDHTGELYPPMTWPLPGGKPPQTRTADLVAPLPPGSARLGATLEVGSDDHPTTWETNLVILPRGWEGRTEARIAAAPPREQPSLRYRLAAVTAELARRHPRQDTAALGATVDELETMLARVDASGTSLPAGGVYLAVIPAVADQAELACSLSLPDGWQRGDQARVLLLMARAPGAEQRAALLAQRVLTERSRGLPTPAPPVIVAIPHLRSDHDPDRARRTTSRVIDWLHEFLACGPVRLAGADLLGATVLETGVARPDDVAGVLLITGMNFAPYPDLGAGALPPSLTTLSPTLPVGWIWFPEEQRPGDQTADLLDALQRRGVSVTPALAVLGGLDFSQVWSRAAIWAAGISQ